MIIFPIKGSDNPALVDDDMSHVTTWPWEINRNGYARCRKGMDVLLHRLVMLCPVDRIVDHRDRNRLNCQRHNLLVTTRKVNDYNREPRGVSFDPSTKRWRVKFGGRTISRHIELAEAWLAAARIRVDELGGEAPPWALNILKGDFSCVKIA